MKKLLEKIVSGNYFIVVDKSEFIKAKGKLSTEKFWLLVESFGKGQDVYSQKSEKNKEGNMIKVWKNKQGNISDAIWNSAMSLLITGETDGKIEGKDVNSRHLIKFLVDKWNLKEVKENKSKVKEGKENKSKENKKQGSKVQKAKVQAVELVQ